MTVVRRLAVAVLGIGALIVLARGRVEYRTHKFPATQVYRTDKLQVKAVFSGFQENIAERGYIMLTRSPFLMRLEATGDVDVSRLASIEDLTLQTMDGRRYEFGDIATQDFAKFDRAWTWVVTDLDLAYTKHILTGTIVAIGDGRETRVPFEVEVPHEYREFKRWIMLELFTKG